MPRKELSVEPRAISGKKVAQLRRQGLLPGNIYGHGIESVSVQVSTEELEHTVRASTANEVIDIKIAGEAAVRPVVIHHISRHPLGRGMLHADFYQVSLREKMRADVPITLIGSSDAVGTYNGVLVKELEALHIEALPLDIPTHIEVDIGVLQELESSVHVRDLKLPDNVAVLIDGDVVVVKVASPSVLVEEEAAPAAVAAGEAPEGEAAGAEETTES